MPQTLLKVEKMPPVLRQQADEAERAGGMKLQSQFLLWMGPAFVVSLGLACTALTVKGISEQGLRLVLRLTARWSFLLFWMAYTGGALAKLFGPSLAPLAKRGREFGLAFAAAFLVHLGAVAALFLLTWRPPLTERKLLFFLTGVFWTYLLMIFSFGGLAKAIGSRGWRALRLVGMNYILCAFTLDFVRIAIHSPVNYGWWRLIEYVPFAVMCVSAPLLISAAAIYRRLEDKYSHLKFQSVVN